MVDRAGCGVNGKPSSCECRAPVEVRQHLGIDKEGTSAFDLVLALEPVAESCAAVADRAVDVDDLSAADQGDDDVVLSVR